MPLVGGHRLPLFLSVSGFRRNKMKIDRHLTLHCLLQTQSGFFIDFQISPILAGLTESPHYMYLFTFVSK